MLDDIIKVSLVCIKTGFTQKAGYNLTATAYRKGVRLVSVVMREETIAKRSQDTIRLLDYGFSNLKCERVFSQGDIISNIEINGAFKEKIDVYVNEDIDVIMDNSQKKEDLIIETIIDKKEPPLQKDQIIGKLKITTPSNIIYEYNLFSSKAVAKLSFWDILLRYLRSLFF